MNILRCLLILTSLASLFVTGPNLVPVQPYAAATAGDNGDYKITKDYKDRIQKDVNAKSSKTNQHLGQDNLCYKDDDCEEATEGEQIKGNNNTASGFNDQSKNIEQQQPALSTIPGIPGNGTTPTPTPTPTPTTSTLTVTKHVECDFIAVPCPTAGDFNITATTGNGSSYTFSGSEGGTPLTINPPFPVTYEITETTPASEDVAFDTTTAGDCSGTISSGQDLTCTITNTARLVTAHLNVCKEVVDSTGGNIQPSNFTFAFSTTANPSTFQGDDECTLVTVEPGQYEFSETGPAGIDFTTAESGDCSTSASGTFTGSIEAGETQTCTVTNTITPPSTLTVTKHVVCDFTAVPCPTAGEFNITATTGNGSSYTFSGSESGTPLTINPPFPVTYEITETTPASDDVEFDTTTAGDCSGAISSGQDLACTITNTATLRTSTLSVTKDVDCNFNSTTVSCPTANQFTITATTGNGSSYTFSGSEGGTPLTINPPFPVTYNVTEASPTQVVATIPVGTSPSSIAFNPDNGDLYVTNTGTSTVSVIDGTTNTVTATIPVGNGPRGIAFNPDNGFLYVANVGSASNSVSVINPATNTVVATIPVGTTPQYIAFNPDNGDLYVTNTGSNTVSVIDGTTNTVTATIPVGTRPYGIAFNPDNGDLYVTNFSGTVSVIDGTTNTVTATIPAGSVPAGIAFNPDNGDLYVINAGSNTVSVIDGTTNTVTATIPVGTGPFDVAFNPDNGDLYVTNFNDNTVSVIDGTTNTVTATIPVGTRPYDVAFNPDNGDLYVVNQGDNTVSVIAPLTTTFSDGCNGTIGSGGQTATCTVTNAFGRPA